MLAARRETASEGDAVAANVYAHHQAEGGHCRKQVAGAIAEERERHARDGHNPQRHADVHENVKQQHRQHPAEPQHHAQPPRPVPEYLDWNWWLGPAPYRPFCNFGGNSPHWDWRWIMDFSGGQLTDWAGHHIDIAQWGLGFERTGPVAVEGQGEFPADGLYDVPMRYKFVCTYANGLQMTVANDSGQGIAHGAKWYGERGWILVNRGTLQAEPKEILDEEIGPNEIQVYQSDDHKGNFLECVRTRRETVAPAEIGHRSISVGLLGEIAMLTGRKIRWNPDTEEIIGDPGASALLGKAYREPWTL